MAQALSVSGAGVVEASLASSMLPSFHTFSGLRVSTQGITAVPSLVAKSSSRKALLSVQAATTVAQTFTTLKPLGDRVLVKIQEAEERSQGGILLPTSAQTKPQGGTVVAVGDGRTMGDKKIAVDIPTGRHVVYSRYAGTEIDFDGAPHLLVKEDDVVGLLDTEDIKDLQPLNDRVLLKVVEAETKTAGGVLLTESAKEKPVIGTVIAAGPGSLGEDGSRKALALSAGSTVLYSKFAGNEFKSSDGTTYVVLKANDVMAVLS